MYGGGGDAVLPETGSTNTVFSPYMQSCVVFAES